MITKTKIKSFFHLFLFNMAVLFLFASLSFHVTVPKMLLPQAKKEIAKPVKIAKAEVSVKRHKKDPITKETVADILKENEIIRINRLIKKELRIDKGLSRRIAESIYKHTKTTTIEPEIVVSVMKIESHGRPSVVSSAGAMGLLQIMPFWKKVMKMENADLFDPDTNIKMGIEVLRRYLKRYKGMERALAAYNGSLGSRRYPDKVLKVYNSLTQNSVKTARAEVKSL